MIVSHRHRFIFMHSLKTAGSSLTIALQPNLGEADFLSIDKYLMDDFRSLDVVPAPFFSNSNSLSLRRQGYHRAADFMQAALENNSFVGLDMPSKSLFSSYRKSSLYNTKLRQHAHLCNVQHCFPQEFETYFKFAVERNPFDKLRSLYQWRWSPRYEKSTPLQAPPTFRDFILSMRENKAVQKTYRSFAFSNLPIYSIDGRVAVDLLIDYDRLDEGLEQIHDKLGLPLHASLPHVKSSVRRGSNLDYDQEMTSVVADLFETECGLFGWGR